VQLWEEGMKEEIESIGEEKWMVLEQVAWNLPIKQVTWEDLIYQQI
jgi:hypothetical protein